VAKMNFSIYFVLFIGTFTVVLLKAGFVYTDQPKFCNLCHVMRPAYEAWFHNTHQTVGCNECHVPASFPAHYYYKAKFGTRDVYSYFFGRIPDQINPSSETLGIVRDNCIFCHGAAIGKLVHQENIYCLQCHKNTAHYLK